MPIEITQIPSDHSDEDLVPTNYNWLRFKWLFWKDCYMQWNTRWEFLFALLMPTICSLVVVILRFNISAEHITASPFGIEDTSSHWDQLQKLVKLTQDVMVLNFGTEVYSIYAPRIAIAFAPNLFAIRNIMEISKSFGIENTELVALSTCDELREKMVIEHYLAGVCFNEENFQIESESIHKIGIYPNRLEFNIIFPSELRSYKKFIGETWDTKQLFTNFARHYRTKGYTPYLSEGFVTIQQAISEAYIYLTCNKSLHEELFIRKFPVAEHYYDPLSEKMETRLSLVLTIAYICPILYMLKNLINERESKLHSLLATMDATHFLQFYSWFVFSLISMSIGTAILLLMLKIPWNKGFCIFTRSNYSCLFALFTAFNLHVLSFCYMISRVFVNRDMALCAVPVFWIITYIPFAVGLHTTSLSDAIHPYVSLFGNTAFALALQTVFNLQYQDGLNWTNFFKNELSYRSFSVGTYGLFICVESVIQVFIGIFAPMLGQALMRCVRWTKQRKYNMRIASDHSGYSKTIVCEVRANYKPPAVEVISLTVEIGDKLILDDVSFNLYEDEITMLMGHNGSGKTTLLQVIAGLKRATLGKVVFKEDSERKEYGPSRDFVGICFNDTLLFQNLYLRHQLMLFGRLKCLKTIELNREVNKYLEALELEEVRYTLTENLTCGQRTKLAVCCALIGGSRVVVLDDVVLKLDVCDYKLIWKLLDQEKFGRVILVSTNLSREPELHADNILMLSQGRLNGGGTAQFLRSMYCFGCHLLISKSESCKSEEVTELLSKFIPDITAVSDLVLELSYHVETSNVELLESMLKALEAAKDNLGIINITIIETPVEELFCKLAAERPAYDDRKCYLRIFNGLNFTTLTDNHSAEPLFMTTKLQTNLNLHQRLFNQWNARFYKFFTTTRSYAIYWPIFIVLPITCLFLCALILAPSIQVLPTVEFDINDYDDAITLLDVRTENKRLLKFVETYTKYLYWKNSNVKVIRMNNTLINDYLLSEQRDNPHKHWNVRIILGLTVRNHVTGWFNGYLPQVGPLVLNLLHNVYLWQLLQTTNAKISANLEFLPIENKVDIQELSRNGLNMGSRTALHLSLIMCYLISIRIIILVKERGSGFSNIQRLAGLKNCNFWITMFTYDMIQNFIVLSISVIVAWMLLPPFYAPPIVFRWCFGLILLGSAALSSSNYLLSTLFFQNNHGAYFKITSLQSIGMVVFVVFSRGFKRFAEKMDFLPRIFPLYSLCRGIESVYDYNILKKICESNTIKTLEMALQGCKKVPNCCVEPKLDTENDVMCLWIIIAISWFGIFLSESRGIFMRNIPLDNYDRALDEHKRRHASDSYEVDGVTGEAIHVQSLRPRMRYYYNVICENLGLIRKGRILVDRLTFTIRPFGIIGSNCNYTNALLSLIAGQDTPSFGRVYINNISTTEEHNKALAHIGYVPIVSCVEPMLTCRQVLKIFCILYGYPRNLINEICEDFANRFGLQSHYNVRMSACSTGIRERVSYAIAILKKPSLICIGNFSWSVDPEGRRQLYRLVDGLRKQGTAIAITSVANSYTEILCTKIAVMHDGLFVHIGRPEKIATEVAPGYSIWMRMKKSVQAPEGVISKVYFRLTAFMEKTFPSSNLVQEGAIMHYYIPHHSTTFSKIYKTLRLNSFQLNIESLSMSTINMNYIVEEITEEANRLKYA
ncbi:ATP-binding cassette sub-family A member 3 isoform X2 [Ceratitis capitata]|uniref:ATP-binding cassette sub-family A member 3 isoform X2 n=1 Tax=Ceratitis capitata TaxID=7213 RepID=UPI000A11F09D|nr:ATP-binding cassette sub-family A member 3 isoform X2 [Ceratitis capitata]